MNIAKLRHTFMRSRTPTGAEMKQQNSLEVPPQIRSASFDEMQLKPGRRESSSSSSSPAERQSFLLRVPYLGPKRSKSFDSGCGDVDDSFASSRKRSSRPSSLDKASQQCVHCVYLEELSRRCDCDGRRIPYNMSLDFVSSLDSSREEAEDEDEEDWDEDSSSDELHEVICGIKVTLSPNSPSSASPTQEEVSLPASTASSPRNKTASPKLERQPAIFHMNTSTELSSQENSFDLSDGGYSHHGSFLYLGSSSEYGTGSRRGARAGAGAAAEGQGAGRSSSEGAGRRAA
nr:eye-specific diacylglycerol kinase-like [Penaeus vannamei]